MKASFTAILIAIVVLLVLASMSLFVVDQRQHAIVFRLGEVVSIKTEPGLYWKVPVIEDVRLFDVRIRTVDPDQADRFLTSEKKNVLVDLFIKWQISDVQQYYISVSGDEARARDRLTKTVNDGLRSEFGKRTVHEVVSGERDQIIELMRSKVDEDAAKIGVKVLDVRLKRVDLAQEISAAVYARMGAERKRVANELRSTGFADAEKIRADADREREIIVANAYGDAQRIKGDGDAQAAALYARSYTRDPEFYAYYRSLEAYRQSFRSKSDLLILEPGSDFFKYMKSPRGRK
jgi:membrane protease subunit HflC